MKEFISFGIFGNKITTLNQYEKNYKYSNSPDLLAVFFITILFSGAVLNYADMDGNSSTGFSGTLDLKDVKPFKHEIAKEVWDWFQTIPFHQMIPRQDLFLSGGYCLANEGVEYYVFAHENKSFQLFLDFPYKLQTEWINTANFKEIRMGQSVNTTTKFEPPQDEDDWILHVFKPNSK